MSIPSPLLFWECGCSQNCTSSGGEVGALLLSVTVLFPKMCCSLQSANAQAGEKAPEQVACAHPSCGSLPAPLPNCCRTSWAAAVVASDGEGGWRQQCWRGGFLRCRVEFWSFLQWAPASFIPVMNFHSAFVLLKLIPSSFQKCLCNSPLVGHCLQHNESAGANASQTVGGIAFTHSLCSHFCHCNCC